MKSTVQITGNKIYTKKEDLPITQHEHWHKHRKSVLRIEDFK